jgi:hypothetical protein
MVLKYRYSIDCEDVDENDQPRRCSQETKCLAGSYCQNGYYSECSIGRYSSIDGAGIYSSPRSLSLFPPIQMDSVKWLLQIVSCDACLTGRYTNTTGTVFLHVFPSSFLLFWTDHPHIVV